MSFTITVYEIKEKYDKAKQVKSLADATIQFLDGCAAYKEASNGSYKQKGAILQIFQGIFSFANEIIPGECGGWTVSTGQKILEWFMNGVMYDGLAHNIEVQLSAEYGFDVWNTDKEAALSVWKSLSQSELQDTINKMLLRW